MNITLFRDKDVVREMNYINIGDFEVNEVKLIRHNVTGMPEGETDFDINFKCAVRDGRG
jgi:hypothetical protein